MCLAAFRPMHGLLSRRRDGASLTGVVPPSDRPATPGQVTELVNGLLGKLVNWADPCPWLDQSACSCVPTCQSPRIARGPGQSSRPTGLSTCSGQERRYSSLGAFAGRRSPGNRGCALVEAGQWVRLRAELTPTFAVESRKGAVSFARPVSPPRSSNRTCGSPASGFPTGFVAGSRHDARSPAMAQSRDTKRPEDSLPCERPDASRGHLVASDEEVAHTVIKMGLDQPVRGVVGARAEVSAPPS